MAFGIGAKHADRRRVLEVREGRAAGGVDQQPVDGETEPATNGPLDVALDRGGRAAKDGVGDRLVVIGPVDVAFDTDDTAGA